jgi:hypothetical protein
MKAEVKTIVFQGPDAEWKRTALVRDQDVFLPYLVLFSSEMEALLAASWEAAEVCKHENHLYLNVDWLATVNTDKDQSVKLANIKAKILEAAK